LAKVLESQLNSQLVQYFETHHLFSVAQHGFRGGRTTVSAVTQLITEVLESFEAKDSIALILTDLSKAFNCVCHSILIGKLRGFGVDGVVRRTKPVH
jgi:hypothetical protein